MKDYQVLIDHAWALDPDLFEMFREQFQIHLNKRRSIKEFQDKLTEGGRLLSHAHLWQEPPFFSFKHPARGILPRKIARNKLPLRHHIRPCPRKAGRICLRRFPLCCRVEDIEIIHPPQSSIAGLSFEPALRVLHYDYETWPDDLLDEEYENEFHAPPNTYCRPLQVCTATLFEMDEVRQVCEEFGWEMPDPLNEETNPRPYVRALMELEG